MPEPWRLQPPSLALQQAPTTARAGTPVPPALCARVLEIAASLANPSRHTYHRLGRTTYPPRLVRPVCQGLGDFSPLTGPSRRTCHRLGKTRCPPQLGARALKTAAPLARPLGRTDHRHGKSPCPARLVCPGLGDCSPLRTPFGMHRPPPGQHPLPPPAGVPGPSRLQPPS